MRDNPHGTRHLSPDDQPAANPAPEDGNWANPGGDKVNPGEGLADWQPVNGEPPFESPPGQVPELPSDVPDPALEHVQPGTSDGPGPGKPEEKADEPPAEEKTAEPEEAAAEGEEAPLEGEDADILGILDKYQTKESLGKAYKHLQQLASGKDEEKKKAEAALNAQADLIDRHFERNDKGDFVLRTEAAAARLNEANRLDPVPLPLPDKRQVWIEEVGKVREELKTVLDTDEPEVIKEALNRSAPRINEAVEQRMEQAKQQAETARRREVGRAGYVIKKYLDDNPGHREIMPNVNKWYERFPAPLRASLVLNNWLPVSEIAAAETAKANFEKAVREAYHKGREVGQASRDAPAGVPAAPGSRVPTSPEADQSEDGKMKSGILNAETLVPLESIFD